MNPPNITKRLSRDTNYKKNGSSYTDNLSDADIKKKLEDYVRVKKEDVPTIPLNTHIRYFSINPKTGDKQFRMGGMLTKHDPNNQYIVCSNGTLSWSVQVANSIIYKKMSSNEYKEHIQSEIQDSVQEQLETLIQENKKLKKVLSQIKDTTIERKNEKLEKPDKYEKQTKPDKYEKPEKPDKYEKQTKPDKYDKPDKYEKHDKQDKLEKPEKKENKKK
jgi:hypothetical protein